jgi:2-iminobutanoate/2-iminopropanoate deaminase
MERIVVSTDQAPPSAACYSQAVVVGDFVFTAGTIAMDPQTGELVGEDVGAQTRQVLRNLQAVLEASGSSLERVIKTTVFLANMEDFAAMNAAYAESFPSQPPARSTVQVGRLARGALLEIEAVALRS